MSDDSQTWSFSAPERAAVFHFSLWIQAVSLALVLGALTAVARWSALCCTLERTLLHFAAFGLATAFFGFFHVFPTDLQLAKSQSVEIGNDI